MTESTPHSDDPRTFERLRRLMQRLNHGRSFEHSVHLVVEALLELVPCPRAALWVLDESGESPLLLDPLQPDHPGVPLLSGRAGWAFDQDEPAWLEDAGFLPHHPHEQNLDRALLAIPIILSRERLGVLTLGFDEHTPRCPRRQSVAELLAYAAAAILERARYRPVDPDTGLLRRDILIPRMRQEMARSLGGDAVLSLLVLGLDHLDGAGPARDQVLSCLARRVRDRIRSADPLAHYHHHRLALLMPGAEARAGLIVAERLREAMTRPIPLDDGQTMRQTLSVGLASWDGQCSARELLHDADRAQRRAHELGGNQVVLQRTPSS